MHSALYEFFRDQGSIIAGVMALIAGAGLYYIGHKQARLTKISADAAREAAEALPKIERAYVFAEVLLRKVSSPFPEIPIDVCFHNHGKTPALITKLRAYPAILDSTPNALNEFPGSENTLPQGLVITANGDYWEHTPIKMSGEEWTNLKSLNKTLFCIGRIEYDDVLGRHRETGFCWHFFDDARGYGFTISPNTKLNYYT